MIVVKMGLRKYPTITLLFMAAFCNIHIQAALTWLEYEIAGFENSNGTLFQTDLKSKRIDKATFAISGTVEIVTDFNNDWDAELNLFHSAKGNNQFVKLPYKIAKDDLCNIVDGIYIKCGAAKDVAAVSDLPAPKENQSLCAELKKGKYAIRQYIIPKDTIPKFLQTGYYKVQVIASKKNSDEVSTFVLHVKLY